VGADDDLGRVVDALYALPPQEFTAARDAASRDVDKELRKAVTALRRPTVAAWLVNRLVREQPELLDQLLALGPALAEAQASRSGDDLRVLGRQRRELVSAVTANAVEDAGRDVTAAVRAEVEQTLEAALADPAAADAVRSGSLVRALSFAGFGGVDVEGAVAGPAPGARPRAARAEAGGARTGSAGPTPARRERAVATAEQAALAAAADLDDAVRACEDAERRRAAAELARQQADEEREAAGREVEAAETRLSDAREALATTGARAHDLGLQERRAAQAAERAVQRVARAQEAAEQARQALDALRRKG
jgi:hypothetical protein